MATTGPVGKKTPGERDLEKVTATAKQTVMLFGKSEKLGPWVFAHQHGQPFLGREFSSGPDYSDEIAREIDDEIRRIVRDAHQTARQVLGDHRDDLDMTSEILLKRETIEREQFIELLEGEDRERSLSRRGAVDSPPPLTPKAPRPRPAALGPRARRERQPAPAQTPA